MATISASTVSRMIIVMTEAIDLMGAEKSPRLASASGALMYYRNYLLEATCTDVAIEAPADAKEAA
jgi:hypothetical protein